jgi:hypothetical protein
VDCFLNSFTTRLPSHTEHIEHPVDFTRENNEKTDQNNPRKLEKIKNEENNEQSSNIQVQTYKKIEDSDVNLLIE